MVFGNENKQYLKIIVATAIVLIIISGIDWHFYLSVYNSVLIPSKISHYCKNHNPDNLTEINGTFMGDLIIEQSRTSKEFSLFYGRSMFPMYFMSCDGEGFDFLANVDSSFDFRDLENKSGNNKTVTIKNAVISENIILCADEIVLSDDCFPDLAIYEGEIIFSNINPKDGEKVLITIKIHNVGHGIAEHVRLFINQFPNSDDTSIEPIEIESIDINKVKTVTVEWTAKKETKNIQFVATALENRFDKSGLIIIPINVGE